MRQHRAGRVAGHGQLKHPHHLRSPIGGKELNILPGKAHSFTKPSKADHFSNAFEPAVESVDLHKILSAPPEIRALAVSLSPMLVEVFEERVSKFFYRAEP